MHRAADQRKFARKPLSLEVQAHDGSGLGELLFEGADLSPGGSFLKSDLLLEPGERLWLNLRLPHTEHHLSLQARVAWVRCFPEPLDEPGMGVEFVDVAPDQERALKQFLAQPG